jgi:hypothetical protein
MIPDSIAIKTTDPELHERVLRMARRADTFRFLDKIWFISNNQIAHYGPESPYLPEGMCGPISIFEVTLTEIKKVNAAGDDGWNPIETIPRDRKILVKTATGLERIASVVQGAKIIRGRIYCWRRDKGHTGDLRAVAWKELDG